MKAILSNPDAYKEQLMKEYMTVAGVHGGMDPWQNQIFSAIVSSNDSIIVNVPPAAGKTRPILNGLSELIKNGKARKVLYVVPIQYLAFSVLNDIEKMDFFLDYIRRSGISEGDPRTIIYKFIGVRIGEATPESSPTGTLPSNTTIIDIATYEHAEALSREFNYDVTIIDEFQEVTPMRYDADKRTKARLYASIIKNSKRLIIITGSLHRDVCNNLANLIKDIYNKKVVVLPPAGTEEELSAAKMIGNRSKIYVQISTEISRDESLIMFIKKRMLANIKNDLLVLFSKIRILNICEKLCKILPNRLDLKADAKAYQEKYKLNLTNVRNYDEVVKFIEKTKLEYIHSSITTMNPLLELCLTKGFGYIIGGVHEKEGGMRYVDEMLKQTSQEKQLVGELMKLGKINLVIATDAVGLGVNLTVDTLIIPSVTKYDGTKLTKIDESSLIQVLHRAGRRPNVVARIITSPESFEYIKEMISKNPIFEIQKADIRDLKTELAIAKDITTYLTYVMDEYIKAGGKREG